MFEIMKDYCTVAFNFLKIPATLLSVFFLVLSDFLCAIRFFFLCYPFFVCYPIVLCYPFVLPIYILWPSRDVQMCQR
jgi:hypothetical protein